MLGTQSLLTHFGKVSQGQIESLHVGNLLLLWQNVNKKFHPHPLSSGTGLAVSGLTELSGCGSSDCLCHILAILEGQTVNKLLLPVPCGILNRTNRPPTINITDKLISANKLLCTPRLSQVPRIIVLRKLRSLHQFCGIPHSLDSGSLTHTARRDEVQTVQSLSGLDLHGTIA